MRENVPYSDELQAITGSLAACREQIAVSPIRIERPAISVPITTSQTQTKGNISVNMQLNRVPCPRCRRLVDDRAPACPSCGEMIYVEHPGDIRGVKHPPLELPPAKRGTYGPRA